MENHPIPQDVTGFKFKLIGSVTVKQFLYLLGFGILTTVAFVLHLNFFIKVPLMMLFAGIGVALTFIPIEGRPMDVMISNFAKTIPSENRYIYHKKGANLASFEALRIVVKPRVTSKTATTTATTPANDKKTLLLSRLRNSNVRADDSEIAQLKTIKSFFENPTSANIRPLTPIAADTPRTNTARLLHQEIEKASDPIQMIRQTEDQVRGVISEKQAVAQKVIETGANSIRKAKIEETTKTAAPNEDLTGKVKELQGQLSQAQAEKDTLAKKVVGYELDKSKTEEQVFTPSQGQEQKQTESVKYVAPGASLAAGFPSLPDIGNVVLGIVRDPRGKTMPNILVEIVDTNNIPVRAFKTNSLGQFASATPLSNGTYKVYFEDPQKQHEFQIIQITLDGSIFNPIEVTSVDSREKLRRELFGGQGPAVAAV